MLDCSHVLGLQATRVGCCTAPGLLLVADKAPDFVPFLAVGAALLISGILSMTLPETLDSGSLDTGQVTDFCPLPLDI